MSRYTVTLHPAAEKELLKLDGVQRILVRKGLRRLEERASEIGKPLSGPLAGCRELKFRADNLRVIYRIRNGEVEIVEIIAIGPRDGNKVFITAQKRI